MANLYWLAIGVLAVWRLTHLLHVEDGPWNMFRRLRGVAGTGFWGSLLGCFYCLSIWTAAPIALLIGQGWLEKLVLWPALSGGAILVERLTSGDGAPPAIYYDDIKEDHNGMLRREEKHPERS